MDGISVNSRASSYITCENIIPKLRRLKIQQSILQKTLQQTLGVNSIECPDQNNFFNYLKKSYREIRNLFEDIKYSARPQNVDIDIQEIRKDIVTMETKIKTFKEFLQSELDSLKKEEVCLIEKINDKQITEIRTTKIRIPHYKVVTSSPVKVIIESPFKCLEVQRLQEFLKNSPNRFGGWHEYNHNIFVQTWNKYYGDDVQDLPLDSDEAVCPKFCDEILHKISGLTANDVSLHCKWYLEYTHLKINQQGALDKWKDNRRKIKKQAQSIVTWKYENPNKSPINEKLCKNKNQSCHTEGQDDISIEIDHHSTASKILLSNDNAIRVCTKKFDETCISRLMRPTKQWSNKSASTKKIADCHNNVENVKKLGVPKWRLGLHST